MKLVPRKILQALANRLPARDIRHPTGSPTARPYLRRYYVCTIPIINLRVYIHHFVDSDPDGLHNHPWKFGGSILLNGHYYEERRFCPNKSARRINYWNIVNGDTLHRVVVPVELKAVTQDWHNWANNTNEGWTVPRPDLGVWTLFFHTEKVMTWATLKDKGAFTQYVSEEPEHTVTKGHSNWYKTAPKGKELFGV